jgi:hypothetical protein
MTRSVELKLYAYRKNRDGLIVSFVVHPNDEDFLNGVHIGQVYQAELEPNGEEAYIPMPDGQLVRAKTEGERLRTRAVLLCKDERFQQWMINFPGVYVELGDGYEAAAACALRMKLKLNSRSELATNKGAQERFLALEAQFRADTGQAAERRGG